MTPDGADATSGYFRPTNLGAALKARAKGAAIIAGGTDYYPARAGKPLRGPGQEHVLDISAVSEMRGIVELSDCHRIGALTTWTEIADARLPRYFDGLRAAARQVGGRQIQNRGTIGGNLCNASPAADGVPALLSMDALVEVASERGHRRLPVSDFIRGPRRIDLSPDEALVAVLVPKRSPNSLGGFFKLGSRRYLVISMVMAGVVLDVEEGRIGSARVAVGACSPVAVRLPGLEAALLGHAVDPSIAHLAQAEHFAMLSPIDDMRASADYRMAAARIAVKRLLAHLGSAA